MDMDNGVGIDCGSGGGGMGRGQRRGKNWDNCNRIAIKNDLKNKCLVNIQFICTL